MRLGGVGNKKALQRLQLTSLNSLANSALKGAGCKSHTGWRILRDYYQQVWDTQSLSVGHHEGVGHFEALTNLTKVHNPRSQINPFHLYS